MLGLVHNRLQGDRTAMQYETFVTQLAAASGHNFDVGQPICRLQDDNGLDVLIVERGHHDGEAYLMSEVGPASTDKTLSDAINRTFLQMNGALEELPDSRITYNPQTEHYLVMRSTQGVEDPLGVCEDLILLAARLRGLLEEVSQENADQQASNQHHSAFSV